MAEPLEEPELTALLARVIVLFLAQFLREVLLFDEVSGEVVRIFIAFPVALRLHETGGGIAQMQGDAVGRKLFHIARANTEMLATRKASGSCSMSFGKKIDA